MGAQCLNKYIERLVNFLDNSFVNSWAYIVHEAGLVAYLTFKFNRNVI